MRVIESCAGCLLDKQQRLSDDPEYLREVKEIIANRAEEDSAPYLVYLFRQAYERRFGYRKPYAEIKKKYNDLVLSLEDQIRNRIAASDDPIRTALAYARAGNYIDFGAMNVVEDEVFLTLLDQAKVEDREIRLRESGSIAEASLRLTNIFEEAQKAVDLYVENMKRRAASGGIGSGEVDHNG